MSELGIRLLAVGAVLFSFGFSYASVRWYLGDTSDSKYDTALKYILGFVGGIGVLLFVAIAIGFFAWLLGPLWKAVG